MHNPPKIITEAENIAQAAATDGKVPGCPGVFAINIQPVPLFVLLLLLATSHVSGHSFLRLFASLAFGLVCSKLGNIAFEERNMPLLKSPGTVS